MLIKVCDNGYVNFNKVTYVDIDIDIEHYSNAPEDAYASVDIYFENDAMKAGYWLTLKEYNEFIRQLEQYMLTPTWEDRNNEIL